MLTLVNYLFLVIAGTIFVPGPRNYYGSDTTNNNAYAITVANDFALTVGVTVFFTVSITNAAANPTLNVNSTGAISLTNRALIQVQQSELTPNKIHGAMYDSANNFWRIFTPLIRLYVVTNPGTFTIECGGYDGAVIDILMSANSPTTLTIAHLSYGVPVVIRLVNSYTTALAYKISVTDPAGNALNAYAFLAASTAGVVPINLTPTGGSLTNGNQILLVGSMLNTSVGLTLR